jgi:two-component system chemotaxis response regulator CheY
VKALIADDSNVSRKVLLGILKHDCDCAEVVMATNGKEAVEAAASQSFDMILLDWNMPEMLGIDALRAIRRGGDKTPIIMVTSEKERARIVEALGAGANGYIVKPFGPPAVQHQVRQVMEKQSYLKQRRASTKALVVDDSTVIRRLLTGVLHESCGFSKIDQASDGVQALASIREKDFDLILLDWNMPDLQGIEVLRKIRAMGKKTPVIMVTSEKEGGRVVEAYDAGANSYLIKPFEPNTLAEKVEQLLHLDV